MPESSHHSKADAAAAEQAAGMTYAVGDIHGCLAKLNQLVESCVDHASGRRATLVFLGDYIDRGPDSAGVIRTISQLQRQPQSRALFEVVALKGNHEAVALDVVDGIARPEFWLDEGGAETLQSYGVADARDLPPEHIAWLRALPLRREDGLRLFVHAGIDPDKPYDAQNAHDLMWIREPFLSDSRDHGRLIVHGHTPQKNGTPDWRGNRLNIDTAAVYGGPLTAAIFSATARDPIGFLQAG
jgi:serine/threonine protein phosphatase 1